MESRDVVVLGVGQTKFGSYPDKSLAKLFADAFFQAADESNIGKEEVEALYYGNFNGAMTDGSANLPGFLADEVGLEGIEGFRFEGACASSSVAFVEACRDVASGYHDFVAVGGSERLKNAGTALGTRALATAVEGIHDMTAGLTFPGVFALVTRLYSKKYDIPLEGLREKIARVSIKNHKYGAKNPKAQFFGRMGDLSVEDVTGSKMISSPLTLRDCCPMTDGGSAVIVTSGEIGEGLVDQPVYVLGKGVCVSGGLFRQKEDLVKAVPRKVSSEKAYEESGLGPEDIDFVEIHDCFTMAEVIAMEAMGFYDYGEGADAVERGKTEFDGELPVNIDGGLIGKGHPVGATGTAQIYTVSKVLRDEYDPYSLDDVEVGMTDTLGGEFGTLCNIILSTRRKKDEL